LPLPPLLLQPLVENALRHGLGARLDGGTIQVSIQVDSGQLVLTVLDDGIGFAPMWREGAGLANVRQRVESLFGPDGGVTIGRGDRGASVTVRVPVMEPTMAESTDATRTADADAHPHRR
jgi:LytS/YehU family sensor histidine kinase